ncbi:MAG: putative Zn-dependent protease [Rickettsiales bacterium]|jgi:predicted Zn-dependent protease
MKKIIYLVLFLILIPIKSNSAGISLIRDAEIEDFLRDLTNPILKAANLNPKEIQIYIVNDSSLNAFVAGGQNIFLNTGLITKYFDPNVLIGVIAHETGHISSGHLARSDEDMQNASTAMIISYIAGIAAAATASPDAGMALIMGGSHIAQRTALKFTRTQEEAADALAIKYLSSSNNTADGLLKILETFKIDEKAYKNQIDEYAITHPISKRRISFIKSNLKKFDRQTNLARNADLKNRLARIIAKLNAFIDAPNRTLRTYNGISENDRYARSIAYYKKGNIKIAIRILDNLILDNPQDGYLFDLKGQILSESGNLKNAIIAYNQAIKLHPHNNLARIALATSIIDLDSKDSKLINFAIKNLNIALKTEEYDSNIYKKLAKAHNQNNDLGQSYLALAQMSLIENDEDKIKKYVKLAKDNLDRNDKTNLLILDDIEEFSDQIKDKDL